jgi:hypothetical protein
MCACGKLLQVVLARLKPSPNLVQRNKRKSPGEEESEGLAHEDDGVEHKN